MRMNYGTPYRTVGAVVFTTILLVGVQACKKKVPPPPPAPVARTVEAPPPPPPPPPAPAARINSFTVEPRSVQRGQTATLAWQAANATDVAIDNAVGAVEANGVRTVNPASTTTYTLTARGPGGTDTRSVTLEVTNPPAPPPPPPPVPTLSTSEQFDRIFGAFSNGGDAMFDYDKSDIRADARQALTADADALKQLFASDPSFSVVLEGHCDERGSAEYNLGLGDRRATAAKEFLMGLGIPDAKVRTISYGKDRPICTDTNEACYQRNRRAHLAKGN